MSKQKKPNDLTKTGLENSSENCPNELLESFEEGRRNFLKKLILSAAYVTPVILSFSIRDLEARRLRRRRPTKRERRKRRRR